MIACQHDGILEEFRYSKKNKANDLFISDDKGVSRTLELFHDFKCRFANGTKLVMKDSLEYSSQFTKC